jgi:D-alanyl-lipoteichoic acid acyltransferase DltB (MBOAT superfamily)
MGWNLKYALLIGTSTIITYLCGIFLDRIESTKLKKGIIAIGFSVNISILFFFKYFNFFMDSCRYALYYFNITPHISQIDVLLLVGISFYTFQALGYIIDVYRGIVKAEKNLLKYALFISFFPQLVAGPIERTKNF